MKKTDWSGVSKIYKQGIESGVATFTTQCPSFEIWDNMHLKCCRFVYEESDNILGWIAVSPTSIREVYKGVVEISVYVDEMCRGKGIGTKLIEYVKKNAHKFGFWSLFSVILAERLSELPLRAEFMKKILQNM